MSTGRELVTPPSTLSYMKLWIATPFKPGDEPKFTTVLVFEKTTDLSDMVSAYNEILQADFDGVLPYNAKPGGFVDGAQRYPGEPWYADKWLLNVSNSEDRPPKILNEQHQLVIDKSQVYSGVIASCLISFYGYTGGTGGIGCNINSVLKIRDGEHMGGGPITTEAAVNAFEAAGMAPQAIVQNPAGQQPAMQPGVQQPAMQPGVQQPAMQPGVQQPVVQPGVQQPVVQPGVQQPGVQQPAMQPGVQQPGMQPGVQQPGMQPGVQQPGMQPGVQTTPPQLPATHIMTPKANGAPYESFVEAGWQDADLITQGYMNQ